MLAVHPLGHVYLWRRVEMWVDLGDGWGGPEAGADGEGKCESCLWGTSCVSGVWGQPCMYVCAVHACAQQKCMLSLTAG